MAATNDSLFAKFTLLNYLHRSRGERTAKDVLSHLHIYTDWGRNQLEHGPADNGLRNVQNWLKDFCESSEFGREIDWNEDPENRKQLLYASRLPVVGERIMTVEEACTLLLAERFLDVALPKDFYEESLSDVFRAAREVIARYETKPKHLRQKISTYMRRIAIAQRGQQLAQLSVPYDVLGVCARAILDGKCLQMKYWNEDRLVHPYGIVIKSPKVYLLAIDDYVMSRRRPAELTPAQFLCTNISDPVVDKKASHVPDDFAAEEYVEQAGLDVGLYSKLGEWDGTFTLYIRIRDAASDNLLKDIEAFPLSRKQTLTEEAGTPHYILKAPGVRASHQLVEWVMGRLDRVEVLRPTKFRKHIANEIKAMHRLYSPSDE
jgi:hypothetical protein